MVTHTAVDGTKVSFDVTQSGAGDPTTTNPTTGKAGDVYVDESTGDVYTYDGTQWNKVAGDNIKTGAGDPNSNTTAGTGGDIYIDNTTGDTYVYNGTSGQWEINSDSLVDNHDGTYTHTAVDGTVTVIDSTQAQLAIYDNTTSGLNADDVQSAIDSLASKSDSLATALASTSDTLVDNHDGTYKHIAVDGTVTVIDSTQAQLAIYNNSTSGLNADDVQSAIDSLVVKSDSLATALANTSDTLVDNHDGTYKHIAVDGTITVIDSTQAALAIYDNTNSGLKADDVQTAIDSLASKSDSLATALANTSDTLVDNHDGTYKHIAGEVNFLRGIVDNKQYGGMFIFQPGSGHFNASDASYVEGFVDKLGDDSFWYPVGEDGYYRPAATVFQVGKQTHFATKYYLSNSDLLYPHQLKPEAIQVIDNREYWQIENVAKTDNQTFVSLTWDEETTPSALIQAAQDGRLGIVRWDAANNMWVDKGGTINLDEKTVTAEVDGFGVFTFGVLKNKHLLPCHIIVYNAVTPNGDGVNDYFRIDNQGNCAKDLHVEIFNRWGVKVFETDHYGPGGDVFDGYSSGRLTIRRNKTQLPTGTYFYILEYQYNSGNGIKSHQQAGYLYLSGN